ncbi:MAG: N-methylproline demethylase [Rhodospirillaceae bacterium]|nr:N-methylproline demethylase [Rhodospirillaceae bacterium]|tara:strand:+ start:4031 stop:6094 length:2064 start_codon:yes stop_codon:yes gene_type:complete
MADPLLQPLTIKNLTLRNRVVSTSHAPGYAQDGRPKARYQLYHEEKARGGIGMTMFGGSSNIAPDSASVFGGQIYVGDDGIIPYFQEFSERVHKHGAALVCQITHMGRRTVWHADNWVPTIAPSRIREHQHRSYPREMEAEDIARVIACYADAARRCYEGDLDGVEILCHGHLPDQFFSPLTNRRTDGYGGSLENRMRFLREVLEACRKAVPDDFIVGIRTNGGEAPEGGLSEDEAVAICEAVAADGTCDYLNIVFGRVATDLELAENITPTMDAPLAPFLARVKRFKEATHLPMLHACRVSDLATARHAISDGIVDLIGMTRAHLADPHLMNRMQAGDEERTRPCVGAGYCIDSLFQGGRALCAHNPATGREEELAHEIDDTAANPRHVVVVGGGPAGMETARVAALRGHRVTVLEAASELGGQVVLAAKGSWRKDMIGIRDWLAERLGETGANIRLNSYADAPDVTALDPDVVVIATGGLPDTELASEDLGTFEGHEHAVSAWDILSGAVPAGESVLVCDLAGRHDAASAVNLMSDQGRSTLEIVTPDRTVLAETGGQNFPIYLRRFYRQGVALTVDTRITRAEPAGNRLRIDLVNTYGGPASQRTVDQLVIDNGTRPNDDLYFALKSDSTNRGEIDIAALVSGKPQTVSHNTSGAYQLFRIGDAASSRNLHAAMLDARRLARAL